MADEFTAQQELKMRSMIQEHADSCWIASKVQEMNGHIDKIHISQAKTETKMETIESGVHELKDQQQGLSRLLIGTLLTIVCGVAVGIVLFLIKGG